jgi:hypothetical protein
MGECVRSVWAQGRAEMASWRAEQAATLRTESPSACHLRAEGRRRVHWRLATIVAMCTTHASN